MLLKWLQDNEFSNVQQNTARFLIGLLRQKMQAGNISRASLSAPLCPPLVTFMSRIFLLTGKTHRLILGLAGRKFASASAAKVNL
jgi:hypothetical protein